MIKPLTMLLLLTFSAIHAQAETIEMKVNGLVCAFCAQGIEKTLRSHSETAGVLVDLDAGLVALTLKDDTKMSDATLRKDLTDSGYTVTEITRTNRSLVDIEKQLAELADE
jgi:copper chaperone CopZ